MSSTDLQRVEVLTEVPTGRRTVSSAAVSVRQVHRLLLGYRVGGGGALIHKARGPGSNRQLTQASVSTRWS